jgi:DNA ligase-associated metallophosphoesterase
MADMEIFLAGERVLLLPEHALYWPAQATLLIADPHLGKAASFRKAAIPVPEGGTGGDLGRLDRAIARCGAERLIVLGDLTHARAGFAPTVVAALAAWRTRHEGLSLMLVRGNHDLRAGDPPATWGFTPVDEPFALGPFMLGHHPDIATAGYLLAGHTHPAVRLKGPGQQRVRLPCFLVGPQRAILPAFGGFTGAATVQPHEDERVYVVADGEVLAVR